ncbi:hypothetical protein ASG68_10090 [Rhizobium sp. Leaf453]|nr:hypothetical protein ASG50_22770 [Rhizobium sp. Leaf386]KQT00274.1 hypothetical protein ASG42_05360 [Rhizobium sp. Leaf391]KQT97278.1 hypothetical protein ASG68_10090 [Rhizobium sp. Leaf453]
MTTMNGSPMVEVASATGQTSLRTALASLLARVCAARVLREHYIWEAVRLLPDTAGLPEDIRHSPMLHDLMEKDAFGSALRLLAKACRPSREFSRHEQRGDRWHATVQVAGALGRGRPVTGNHHDPAAAMLIALLRSAIPQDRQPRAGRRLRASHHQEFANE